MRHLIAAAFMLIAMPALAEVRSSSDNSFEIEQQMKVRVPAPALLGAFGRVEEWWSGEHSYSGNAANLSLTMVPGGCFCERLENGGGVEHLRVAHVEPGRQLVLTGALGPLLGEAVNGVMLVKVEPSPGGSRLTLSYRASGFARGGADKFAPIVDRVLAEQLGRLRAYMESGKRP